MIRYTLAQRAVLMCIVRAVIRMRHLVAEHEGLYWARAEEAPLLRYHASSIARLLAAPPIAQAAE